MGPSGGNKLRRGGSGRRGGEPGAGARAAGTLRPAGGPAPKRRSYSRRQSPRGARRAWIALACAAGAAWLAACAQVGPPQPPSANLPAAPAAFHIRRLGAQLELRWTAPNQTTDGVALQGAITPWLCLWPGGGAAAPPRHVPCPRRLRVGPAEPPGGSGGARLRLRELALRLPGVPPLPATAPRNFHLALLFANDGGRFGARSRFRLIPAMPVAPPPVWLPVRLDRRGILLRWRSPVPSRVRIERRRLGTIPPNGPAAPATSAPAAGAQGTAVAAHRAGRSWRAVADVSAGVGRFLDRQITWGEIYGYRLYSLAGHGVEEVTSAASPVLTVPARNLFPPARPSELESVVSPPARPGAPYLVALSWLPLPPAPPVTIAGYNLYRRRVAGPWRRLNASLLLTPAFSDSVSAPAGTRWQYAVTAVAASGVEGPKSAPVTVRLPATNP